MAKEIYNKNAREAHLMAEAYSQVNEGHAGPVHNWKQQAGLEKRYQLISVGGQHGQIENVEGEFDTIDEVIKHIGPLRAPGGEYGNEWVENIKDSQNWSAEGFEDGLLHFNIGGDYEIVDTQSVVEDAEDTDHDKGVQMALEALELFKDELRVGGHGEDINVNELADAHDQLSRALHWLLDDTDVEFITGGRATQQAERDVDFKPAHGEY
tara:strand:- start:17 stop:646 length:630 start_codon:yes stop_codon:yes gene_type:complete